MWTAFGPTNVAIHRMTAAMELGIISVDWAPHEREGDKLLFLFDCGDLGDDEQRIRLDGGEVDRWEWVDPVQLDSFVIPRIARRIRFVVTANGSEASYLEHGEPPARPTTQTLGSRV